MTKPETDWSTIEAGSPTKPNQIRDVKMFADWDAGGVSKAELGRRYGICPEHVRQLINRRQRRMESAARFDSE